MRLRRLQPGTIRSTGFHENCLTLEHALMKTSFTLQTIDNTGYILPPLPPGPDRGRALRRYGAARQCLPETRLDMPTTHKKTTPKVRGVIAARPQRGKVKVPAIRLPITNLYTGGIYTGAIRVGSRKTLCNVELDTGSSNLAIAGTVYDAGKDKAAAATHLVQDTVYFDGSNVKGGVVMTNVTVGSRPVTLHNVPVEVVYPTAKKKNPKILFNNADGILGLAYKELDTAYAMPVLTLHAQFTDNQLRKKGKKTLIEPYFTQLESAGLVANKFAFYTRRSEVSRARAKPANDPLNHGVLVLGGGEEQKDLYSGTFQVAPVVQDTYYATRLKSIIVGDNAPIILASSASASGSRPNCRIDTASNRIVLGVGVFNAIVKKLSREQAVALDRRELSMSKLDLPSWPPITFVLAGASRSDVKLTMTPETYWQTNSPKPGFATPTLQSGGGPHGITVLGLPLLNNYYTVFDRSANKGLGVMKFAKIK
jgi:Eukaryotic aspartyl protease